MILDNSVDLGLIETYPVHSDLLYEPFTQDGLCAIAAPSHPLTHENSVTLSQIRNTRFWFEKREAPFVLYWMLAFLCSRFLPTFSGRLPLAQPINRDLNIIYHKSKYMTSPMRDFVNLCKQFNLHNLQGFPCPKGIENLFFYPYPR